LKDSAVFEIFLLEQDEEHETDDDIAQADDEAKGKGHSFKKQEYRQATEDEHGGEDQDGAFEAGAIFGDAGFLIVHAGIAVGLAAKKQSRPD